MFLRKAMKVSVLFSVTALTLTFGAMAHEAAGDVAPGFVKVEWSEKTGEKWTIQGLADREAKRPMTKDTLFAICSNTKPIASVLVLTLVEEGVLNLDDPVSKYFPEFANITFKGKSPKSPVTLRQLVTHLSGLPYRLSRPGENSDMLPYRGVVQKAVKKGLRKEPGESYQYCGVGFQVMGAVIEQVTGRTVPELMQERIFKPLGMTETTFYPDAALLARTAIPYHYPPKGGVPIRYDFTNRWTAPLDNPARTAMLSGGLFSTVGDYLKFSQMIVRKGVGLNGRRILSEKMFDDYLFKRQTPPGDKTDSSFDIGFSADHTSGGKGGLFATMAQWNWTEKRCVITFRAKSPYAPKGIKSDLDATGFDGKKTTFVISETKVTDGQASCLVSNNEDRHGTGVVQLLVNGHVVAKKPVALQIGESKWMMFSFVGKSDDAVTFTVGTQTSTKSRGTE